MKFELCVKFFDGCVSDFVDGLFVVCFKFLEQFVFGFVCSGKYFYFFQLCCSVLDMEDGDDEEDGLIYFRCFVSFCWDCRMQ